MPTEEEIKAMQEKLRNMSPEELKEFQKQNCVFCQIASGRVNSKKIYEDEKCLAILDINPANPGHILLLPKEHYAIMPLVPDDVIKHIFMVSKQLSAVLLKALQAQGTNIFAANGAAAGQKAQHFMVHIIPRVEKDGIGLEIKGKKASGKELEELSKVLAAKISQDLGLKAEQGIAEEKPKVVEAEFKEEKPAKEKEAREKKPRKKKGPEEIKKARKAKEEVSLDDIAELITGGK